MCKQTKKFRPEIRPATIDDIRRLSEHPLPSMRAWVAEMDGEIIAACGLVLWAGRWYIFADVGEKMKPFKISIVKHGMKVIKEAKNMGLKRLYAKHDSLQPAAVKWMHSLGFHEESDFFVWRG